MVENHEQKSPGPPGRGLDRWASTPVSVKSEKTLKFPKLSLGNGHGTKENDMANVNGL